MESSLVSYIQQYGYLAIFLAVFLPELGIPNPTPVELVLLIAGYLAARGVLSLPLVLTIGVVADFLGVLVLYGVFYMFGRTLVRRAPRWLPVDVSAITAATRKISHRGRWGFLLARLVPYARNFVGSGAGLFQVPPYLFVSLMLVSSLLWGVGIPLVGFFAGERLDLAASFSSSGVLAVAVIPLVAVVVYAAVFLYRKFHRHRTGRVI